jgi:hypothetical protein
MFLSISIQANGTIKKSLADGGQAQKTFRLFAEA